VTLTAAQEPESIKDELEAFCQNARGLETFYGELKIAAPASTPAFSAAQAAVTSGADIPALGLPPGVLAASAGSGMGEVQAAVGVSSRAGSPSPAFMSASQLLRRGSVQYEGIIGGLRGMVGQDKGQ
jgi:hypothetical protein